MTSVDMQHEQSQVKINTLLSAVLLIFVQFTSGMRMLPQLSFIVIYLQEELHLLPVTISSVVAGAQVAGMLTALLGGVITGRLGSKGVLIWGLVLSGISSLAFLATSLWTAVFLWFLGGAGLALMTVGGASYLTRISMRGTMGLLAAFYALSTTAGGAVGNPITGLLIENHGFAILAWASAALSALTILVVIIWMANLQDHTAKGASPRSFGLEMLATASRVEVRLLVGLRSLPTIFYGTLMVLIPLLLNDLTGSKVLVAAYGTTNLVVASAAQLLAGRAADRWGARGPTLVGYAGLVLAGIGLAASAGSVLGLYLFGVLGISAAWALATLMFVWVSDGVEKSEHPATFGLLHAVWSLSMIGGSLLGGWFVTTQPGLPFLIGGLVNIGSLFLIVRFYRLHSQRSGTV
jgi:MFS family permease